MVYSKLVGGWTNPSEKYARQIGSWNPKDRGENKKNVWNHHPEKCPFIWSSFQKQASK